MSDGGGYARVEEGAFLGFGACSGSWGDGADDSAQILPLHPLTMEDILHQETREKIESFSSLGYYFIVFRALDETYFQYTSPDVSPVGSTANVAAGGETEGSKREKSQQLPGSSSGRGGRVDIVEGVGGKEGVEGVGVGAVNLYLIVFGDGILSVSWLRTWL